MAKIVLAVKNWKDFQHYKRRNPPWIRFYRNLLDNYEFQCLPIASKALAPQLWLLASETQEGIFNGDPAWLAFRLRMKVDEVQSGLTPLIEHGFFIVASTTLASRLHDATPETEAETETEAESSAMKGDFSVDIYTGEVAA